MSLHEFLNDLDVLFGIVSERLQPCLYCESARVKIMLAIGAGRNILRYCNYFCAVGKGEIA